MQRIACQVADAARVRALKIHEKFPFQVGIEGSKIETFYDPDLIDEIVETATRLGIKPKLVEVEFDPDVAATFSGRLAQAGFLVGNGSNYYTPYDCELRDTLFVRFDGSLISGFDGTSEDIKTAKSHYEWMGQKYGIDSYFVHTWRGGIHPGCGFVDPASTNFERWTGGAFGNPRVLHFHTCGS